MKLCLLLSRRTWPTICITFRRINHGSQPPEKSEDFHPFCSLALLLALSLSSSSMCLSITSESESRSVVSSSLWPHGLHSPWNSPCQNTGVGSLSLLQGIFQGLNPGLPHCRQILYQLSHKRNPLHSITAAKSLQSCPTLCDPRDGSPPIPGILQARTLEWVAISFSKAWKWKVKSESEVAQSCLTLSDPMDCSLPGSSVHVIFQAGVLEWGAIAFSNIPLLVLFIK